MNAQRRWVLAALAIVAIVATIWLAWALIGAPMLLGHVNRAELHLLGQLGDLFGAVNALFAAFAFAGVALAAIFQYMTMKVATKQHQLEEKRHAQVLLEPLLFHLLALHRGLSEGMRLTVPGEISIRASQGPMERDAPFRSAVDSLRRVIAFDLPRIHEEVSDSGKRTIVTHTYDIFHNHNEAQLGPFFRSLYHIFKLIHGNALEATEKVRYANIARATLDKDTLFLLAVNCTTERGREFVPLIEEYGLLKHISRSKNDPDHFICGWFYSPTATMSADERKAYSNSRRTQLV